MSPKKHLVVLLAVSGLALTLPIAVRADAGDAAGGTARQRSDVVRSADAGHHEHEHGATGRLSLDHGRKWPTDDALRRGMSGMRDAMGDALPAIRADRLDAAGYATLVDRLEREVAQVVADCRLPPDADAQLHVVLARLGEGLDAMRSADDRHHGAGIVADALNAYGRHFRHPGWTPLRR